MLAELANLITGAFFFAMRSCEYLHVPARGKTTILKLSNITFSDENCRVIRHRPTERYHNAKFVSICFNDQKSGKKDETRTHQQTNDPIMCPVKAWTRIVLRLQQAVTTTAMSDPSVNLFIDTSSSIGKQTHFFSQASANNLLRFSCKAKPELFFGYDHRNIGTHSIRAGAAMALFLAAEHPSKIMILGRWSSDAYLLYIRPQVQEWTSHMSTSMITHDDFHIAPNARDISAADHQSRNPNNRVHPEDPLLRHDRRRADIGSNPQASNNGPNPTNYTFTRFHIYH